jgi:hypothetical protein
LADDLVRAGRQEAAVAVMFWWGVTEGVVWRWRKALEVKRMENRGSRRLVLAASAKGADALRGVPLSEEQDEQRQRSHRENNLTQYLPTGWHGPRWTVEDMALLRQLRDSEVARRTGRTVNAVRIKREELGIANPAADYGGTAWTAAEDELVRTLVPAEAARRTGRTLMPDGGLRPAVGAGAP